MDNTVARSVDSLNLSSEVSLCCLIACISNVVRDSNLCWRYCWIIIQSTRRLDPLLSLGDYSLEGVARYE
jgi:hypothetical protein